MRTGFVRWAAGRTSVEGDAIQIAVDNCLVEIPISYGAPAEYIQTVAEFFVYEHGCHLVEVAAVWRD